MKKKYIVILQIIISTLLISCFASVAGAAQYYVSATGGNDSNAGTSAQPFQTIQKCANVAKAGDTCNINSGTYREMVTVANSGSSGSPITLTSVTGQSVIISGANVVTGWALYSGNIYVANVGSITAPTQLYVDGNFYDIAHYPTSGYLSATSNSSNSTTIIDSKLALTSAQVVGAGVVSRSSSWFIDSKTASAYDSTTGTITVSGSLSQTMATGYGFYLQNMLWMVNYPGSWFYDSSAGKIYLWTAGSDNPANHTVEVSSRSYGITDSGKNYITIQNLSIANANQYDVNISSASNVTLNNLSLSGGNEGIQTSSMTNSTVQNNSVQNTLSAGIYLNSSSNDTVSNNKVNNAGNVGMPKYSQGALGVYVGSSNVTISSNTVTNSGYIGIFDYADTSSVQNNTVDRSCLVLDDCAGIYTYPSNNTIAWSGTISGNTVTNSIGNFSGTSYTFTQAQGIYLDDLSNGFTVSNNTVTNADFGIFLHSGYNNNVTGNKVYSARMYGFRLSEDNYGGKSQEVAGVVHNNVVTGNTFETIGKLNASWSGSGAVDYYSMFGTIANFGTYNNNQYCHPNISYAVGTDAANQITNYTLANWQKASGQDLNSTDTSSDCSAPQDTFVLTTSGTGLGKITSSPAGINCGSTCSASFNSGTVVTLTAVANSGSVFTGWSGACSGTGTCSVTMNASQSVMANFTASLYNLTVSTTGNGFGAVLGTGIDCGVDGATECSEPLNSGTAITLTAVPANGSVFSSWSGACSGTGSCVVTMNAAQSVSASFSPVISLSYLITASAGSNGTITPASVTLTSGSSQTFTLTPASGYTAHLTVDGITVALTSNTYTLSNVTAIHTLVASFTQNTVGYLITASDGSNGTITPASVTVTSGGSQTFTLTPASGYTAHLTVDGITVTLTSNTYTLSNVTATHTLSASFTQNASPQPRHWWNWWW